MNNRLTRYLFITIFMGLLIACGMADLTSQFTASPTPVPPTETPLPSPTPEPAGIPGWKKFEGGGIEIWLQESFEGGDLSQDLELILEGMEQLGPEFDQFAQLIAQNPEVFLIFAFDINPTNLEFITNVNVTAEETLSAFQIEDYIEASLSQLPSTMEVVKTETLTINQYDAGMIELAYMIEGLQIHQRVYVIKQGGNFWGVTYTTSEAEFAQRLPEFEQSINTFRIIE